MKKIQIFRLLCIAMLLNTTAQASFRSTDSTQPSTDSGEISFESNDSDDTSLVIYPDVHSYNDGLISGDTVYFIVKPTIEEKKSGKYISPKHFNDFGNYYVVKAQVVRKPAFLKGHNSIKIIQPELARGNTYPQSDFVRCQGPSRVLSEDEYYDAAEQLYN